MATAKPKNKANEIQASLRTEFGKGAARRARRDGLIPVVIYGSGFEPQHVTVDRLAFSAIVRNHGVNAVLDVHIDGSEESQLALIKHLDQNVLTFNIDHADLLAIRRGEKVEVEVPVIYEGEPAPGAMVIQDADTLLIEADVLSIPEELIVDIEGLEIGTQVTAADIDLPEGITLQDEADLLIINVVEPEVEPEEDEEEGEEGAEAAEDKPKEDEDSDE